MSAKTRIRYAALSLAPMIAIAAAAPAVAQIQYTIDGNLPGGGDCAHLGGMWNAASQSCQIADLFIGMDDGLQIDEATLWITNSFDNDGIVENFGILEIEGATNNSNYIGNGQGGVTVNDGIFHNNSTVANFGRFTNVAGGLIHNVTGEISNNGYFSNAGVIVNDASVGNNELLDNSGTMINNPTGQYVNFGTVVNRSTVDNEGMFINYIAFINQCAGTVLNNAVIGNPLITGVSLTLGAAVLDWCEVPGAAYDVVRGDLGILHGSAGDFNLATEECLGDDVAALSVAYVNDPDPGEGYWFLVRPTNGDIGSYDSGFTSQVNPRDAGIVASGADCP